ncbi:viral A-type inclusion protein [Reticulomyxa filosa]|uniref:Viral A-type inclusion protein n=1 Tax=Reticulomyxa filosa TaxID=46433 RepID=X6NZ18_RETFI|nr:viral A-type inclusion protein [Reticulomyxa filosa]|eukprot:ETO31550.1 viral A-type inclusion protein [Reticulomyxa filosa]
MAEQETTVPLALSVQILEIQKPTDLKKDQNLSCKIHVTSSRGSWELTKYFKEIEIFHANLIVNEQYRGVSLPQLPNRKVGSFQGSMEDYVKIKTEEYKTYFNGVFRRTILLGGKDVQEFGQFPSDVRRAADHIAQHEVPFLYFVLLPSYLLQYFESKDAYQIGLSPKGCIDLTSTRSLLIYEGSDTLQYAFGIKTPKRTWKLQCDNELDKAEWVSTLRKLLESEKNGYVPEYTKSDKDSTALPVQQTVKIENQQVEPVILKKNIERFILFWIHNWKKKKKPGPLKEQRQVATSQANNHLEKLQQELDKLQTTSDIEKNQIRSELTEYHKKQLEIQQEKILQFKEQIELITSEMAQLEMKRNEVDAEYEKKISELQSENERLADNLETTKQRLEAQLTLKMEIIEELEGRNEKLEATNEKLQQELEERKEISLCMEGELFKFIGDTEANLKLKKQPQKKTCGFHCQFQTYHVKVEVMDENVNNTIGKEYPHWFKVVGHDRIALFVTGDEKTKNQWIALFNKSLPK